MKRLNPKTGKFFKLGDSRDEDNLLFRQYVKKKNGKSTIDKDGFYAETWRSPEDIKIHKETGDLYMLSDNGELWRMYK